MPKKETMDVIEKTLETVEDTLDTVGRIPKVRLNGTTKQQQIIIPGVTVGVSVIASGGLTYLLSKKKFQAKYEKIAEKEIAEAKTFYSALNKKEEFSDPTSALENIESYTGKVKDLKYVSVPSAHPALQRMTTIEDGEADELVEIGEVLTKDAEKSAKEVRNVFADAIPAENNNFDYEEELKTRSETAPYVLSHDEFYQGVKDYQQNTLTYFEGDDVLTDDRDQPINETEMTVGDVNFQRFGHGSNDNNIVYIRNDRLEIDFEVIRSQGKYVQEILGFMEHSHRPGSGKVRRFRSDDG